MEAPDLYIPPCCIHKQLPALIRQGGAFSVFYSQGDWGLPKLNFAVENMVSSCGVHVSTILVMPDATLETARFIEQDLRMRWSEVIILVTASDQTELLRKNISPEYLTRFTYCPSRPAAETSNLWIRRSDESHLMIIGPIFPTDGGHTRVCSYTANYSEQSSPARSTFALQQMKAAFAPWRSMIRLHATMRGTHPLFDLWLKR